MFLANLKPSCQTVSLSLILLGCVPNLIIQNVDGQSESSARFLGGLFRRAHPLDPLSESEIRSTTNILNNHLRGRGEFLFNYITLKEPAKSALLPYFLQNRNPPPRNSDIPRKAFAMLLQKQTNQVYEFVVNLNTRRVESQTLPPANGYTFLMPDELRTAFDVVRNDSRVQERCRQLGWTDMNLVIPQTWSLGYVGDRPEYPIKEKRLVQMYLYGRNFAGDNQIAHPFDFLPIVDLLKNEVIAIEELPTHEDFDANNKEGNTVPRAESQYDPDLRNDNGRRDLRPVRVSQLFQSFSVNGNEVSWQKYKFRVGFSGREGLILHHINYNDNGTVRPLFYRMSVAEMFVPYGDPRSPYHRKHVFDEGQYGLGFTSNSLRANIDCIGNPTFFDAIIHNSKGEPVTIPRAVCVREEDAGILWKHTDFRTGKSSITRSQRLALTFISTVGNYDYIYTWNFYQDGSVEFHVQLTGLLTTNMFAVGSSPAGHGTAVFDQVNAQYHQHYFGVRMDVEIDGNQNSVTVADVISSGAPGSTTNPYGQGFTTDKKLLKTAGEAKTSVAPTKSRTWLMSNPDKQNPYTKQPTAYKLMPFPTPSLLMQKESPIFPYAAWVEYDTWVTPYQEDQLFPGGFYLNGSGLPEWVGQNENANIDNTDVVLWHNVGVTHIPRVEDFPIMPAEHCGFFLKPYNFFKENPALDVPPPRGR